MCVATAVLVSMCHGRAEAETGIPEAFRESWLALLHYRDHGGTWVSDVPHASFFVAESGATSPEQEWRAARRAFLATNASGDAHAQCRFPARFALMKRALNWSARRVRHVQCPQLEAFERKLGARKLWVVFASHYLDNPASAFGHAMLYLGSGTERAVVLSDYSVSFEAELDGIAPAAYIPRGLLGGLVASFRVSPLHERVRKYERQEQRDLWLYPLQVDRRELDQLVRHLWELEGVSFEYGFFRENCAQKLLAVVHAVAPKHGLLPFRGAAVLPSEVVERFVDRLGTTGEPIHRPSLQSRYGRQVARLDEREREQLETMIASRTVPAEASPAVVSAAMLWSELNIPHRAFRRASDTRAHRDTVWRRELWAARSSQPSSARADLAASDSPRSSLLASHGPSRLTVRSGYRQGHGAVFGLGARWLLHEPLDPPAGYPSLSTLEIARVDVAATTDGDLLVDEATAVRVQRLAPASGPGPSLVWGIDVGARRVPHAGGTPLHVGAEVGLGAGMSVGHSDVSASLYSMVGARPGAAVTGDGTSFLFGGVGSAGLLVRLPANVRARVSGEYVVPLTSPENGAAALFAAVRKGVARNWDLELSANLSPERSGALLGLVVFH